MKLSASGDVEKVPIIRLESLKDLFGVCNVGRNCYELTLTIDEYVDFVLSVVMWKPLSKTEAFEPVIADVEYHAPDRTRGVGSGDISLRGSIIASLVEAQFVAI